MFSKLSDKLKSQDFNFEALLSKIDFNAAKEDILDSIRNTVRSIDDSTKSEIRDWLTKISEIKTNTTISDDEKQKKLSDLKTSETVLKFLQSLIKVIANKIPIENKSLIETSLTGLGIAASILNLELSGIALIAFSKGLPKFLMTNKFDELSVLIEKEITN